jgi:hypothetical protein
MERVMINTTLFVVGVINSILFVVVGGAVALALTVTAAALLGLLLRSWRRLNEGGPRHEALCDH